MVDTNTILNKTINILQDHMTDYCNATRVGSYVFGPNQELSFGRQMPKMRVNFSRRETNNFSFGVSKQYNKLAEIDIDFYVQRGETGSGTAYKNEQLVSQMMEEAANVLLANLGSYTGGNMDIIDISTVDTIPYMEQGNAYVGTMPVIFIYR